MRQRVLQGTPAVLNMTLADQDGTPVAASGALTVAVTQADGTVVLAAGTATTSPNTGVYTVTLTAAQTAALNLLTAVWTDAGNGRVTTTKHEIVGGYYFSISDARTSNNSLIADTAKYPDALLLSTRQEVEEEAERICDVAFVPRYRREILDGLATPEIILGANMIRTVRSVKIYPIPGGTQFTALTAAQLSGLRWDPDGMLHRTDFGFFDEGRGNIVIEYEHGWDQPPADVRRASLTRLRSRLNFEVSGVNERATTFTADNGQSYKLATADAFSTGIPDVDAAYDRYSFRERGSAGMKAATRPLNLDPQRYSVFHGGVR
ncbi:MAG TPA: hypothetical protein VGH54_12145 [Mycobacterium sp.]|uniref:hypothetical protein n=1 Tax=Mycobacterium sp. TaxID=1785 RepID=UPI002F409AEA